MRKINKSILKYNLLIILNASIFAGCSGGSNSTTSNTGQNWSVIGESGFAASSADVARIAVGSTGNTITPYVVYSLPSNNNFPGYVQQFNGTSWVQVGPSFGNNVAGSTLAVLNKNGSLVPYIAYQDMSNSGKLAVKSFNGTSWVSVGDPATVTGETMGAGQATSINMDFDSTGNLYIAYEWYPLGSNNPMEPNGGHPSMIKYDSTKNSWATIGGQLSESTANATAAYLAMKIAPDNIATLAYANIGNRSNALYLQQLNLNSESAAWSLAGTNFSPSPFIDIDVASSGKVLAIYADLQNFNGATSLYSNSDNLVSLAPFSNGYIGTTPSTVLGRDNIPYVVFQGEQQRGVLKSYNANTNTWAVIASSPDTISNPQLARDADDNIYVLYSEPQKNGQLTVMKYSASTN